ncbi:MAG: SDR family NAD(P)-dependent oxidoreductase [Bacteroidota bacterium]
MENQETVQTGSRAIKKQRTVLITGATSGIGRASARVLAEAGFAVLLCGRREERLKALADELSPLVPVLTRCFDVRDRAAAELALNNLPAPFDTIDILLNNAGGAHGRDPIHTGSIDDWEAMIDANLKGLLYVSRIVIPQMTERKSGHIINISSISGREVYAGGAVYCGTKAAVDSVTEGMRIDLNPFGIKVSAVSPGMVETEFSLVRFKGDQEKSDAFYRNMDPLTPEDIADLILFMVTRKPHIVIADVLVMPVRQANTTIFNRPL